MSEFGELLKTYRKKCRDVAGKPLTQAQLAELLGQTFEVGRYSGSTVSNWERGENLLRHKDRHVLVKLVKILHQWNGIATREEADRLLLAGNYSPLDDNELREVNPAWQRTKTTKPGEPPLLSAEEQEAMLPPPSYRQLFGFDDIINHLTIQLLSSKSPYLLVIVGLGGIGKTALAHAVARRIIRTSHFVRVIWFSTETLQEEAQANQTTTSTYRAVIEALSQQILLDRSSDHNPTRQLARVRSELKRRRYLIIVDNLEHSAETNWLLKQLNHLAEPSKFLFTSRYYPSPETEAQSFPLKNLSLQDANAFLRYQAERAGVVSFQHITNTELAEMYQVVGGHPMALRLIPHLTRMYSLSQILTAWREGQGGYIAQLYQVVYEPLWQSLHQTEKQLLQAMPLVAQAGVTQQQLRVISNLPWRHFYPALEKLQDVCLIEQKGTPHDPRYGIHSLTEHFLLSRWGGQGWETADLSFNKSILANLDYWHRYLQQLSEKQWHTLDVERANIFRAIRFSLLLPAEQITSTLKARWQEMAEVLFRFVERRGYGQEWIPLFEAVIQKFDGDVNGQCHLLNRLGELYRLTQQLPKAVELHHKALAIAQEVGNELEVGLANLSLGTDYYRSKQYDQAVLQGQVALEIFNQLKLSGRETAATLNLLGNIAQVQEDFALSENYLRKAIAIWRQLPQFPELARTLNNLALTLQGQERIEEALVCYQEAKRVLARTASDLDHVLIALSEGTLYFRLHRYTEAEKTFKRINLSVLKESGHLLYQALALNNLGNVAFVQGKYEEAEKYLQQCVLLWQQMDDEVELADTFSMLGNVARTNGDLVGATSYYKKVITLMSPHSGNSRADQLIQKAKRQLEELDSEKTSG